MKILASLAILLSLISCSKDSLHNRRVPLYNEAYLADQNKFYNNYSNQDAYMNDSKKDKTFFNNLFDGDESEKVNIIDEASTGNLQKMSNEYKSQESSNQQTAAIAITPKPVDVTSDKGYIPNEITVSNYELLPKSVPGIYVQVAAFTNYQDALNITAPLLKYNNVAINERDNNSGGSWYRVRVGPSANRDLALALQKNLKKAGYKDSLIIVEK